MLKNIVRIIFLCLSLPAVGKTLPVCNECNVVIIAVDALQASHVSHLGYSRKTTPNIDDLAGKSLVFTNAISPSSWTVPTYLSIFSSQFPSVHRLVNRYKYFSKEKQELFNFEKENPNLKVMAEVFKENGYATGGFTGDSGVSRVLGYSKGFDEYFDETVFGGFEGSTQKAKTWLKSIGNKKYFLFVHGYDSHGQFSVAPSFKLKFGASESSLKILTKEEQSRIRELGLKNEQPSLSNDELERWRLWYDSKIADADSRVGEFIDFIHANSNGRKTIIVVLSDHGTEFYEHGRFDHGHSLYDELIHVPFVINVPGIKHKRVDDLVSTIDLLPTLIDFTGLKVDSNYKKNLAGISLAEVINSKIKKPRDVFMETDYRNMTHIRAIQTHDGWKYIATLETGHDELYFIKSDKSEKLNLIDKDKKMGKKLRAKLFDHLDEVKKISGAEGYFQVSPHCLPVYKDQCKQ